MKKRKTSGKIVAVVLAAALVSSVFPTEAVASAAEDYDPGIMTESSSNEEGEITILDSYELEESDEMEEMQPEADQEETGQQSVVQTPDSEEEISDDITAEDEEIPEIEAESAEVGSVKEQESDKEDYGIETFSTSEIKYGFSITTWSSSWTYKRDCQLSILDNNGTMTFPVYFYCDGDESWIDSNVTFTVEDVTPTAYKNIFKSAGVGTSFSTEITSAASRISSYNRMGYKIEVQEPFTSDGPGAYDAAATSGKLITVTADPGVRAVKVSALQNGTVLDYIYLLYRGENSTGSDAAYSDYDLELYEQIRQYIESQLWTSGMSNLEKITAVASYINSTTHYPSTDATSKSANPSYWNDWAVDGMGLYYNLTNDVILNRIAQLQGGIGTCTMAQLLDTVAEEDLGLPYLYSSSTGVASGEGVWIGIGSASSTPSNSSHYSLIYQSASGTKSFVDAQGMETTCDVHNCADKIIPLNFTKISSCSVSLSKTSYTYDGSAKKPTVTVKDGSTTLTKGTDYTVSYSNNKNAGTATVTIKGKGSYIGTTKKTFTISAKSLTSSMVSLSKTSYTYNGSAKKPTAAVKDGSTTLTKGTDYTVSYSNNTSVGTATATVKGKGNYTGSVKKNYKISKGSQKLSAKAAKTSVVKGKTTTIKASGKGTITYSTSNKKVAKVSSKGKVTAKEYGKATITVKAAGNSNYKSASKKITIKVVPKSTSIKRLKNSKSKKAAVKWKKVSGVTGYQIQYSTSKSFKSKKSVKVKGSSKVSKTLSKLKKGKTYYVRVRSYKTVSGTTYYSSWSSKKSVKVKK